MRSRTRPFVTLVSLAFLLAPGCVSLLPGSGPVAVKEFTITANPEVKPLLPPRRPARLRVAMLDTDGLFQRTEFLLRGQDDPSSVRYLTAARWADFPSRLVTECLREQLRLSEGIGEILPHNDGGSQDAILRGRLVRFEGLESKTSWQAHLVLDLRLHLGEEERTIPLPRVDITVDCSEPTPAALARALSLAVTRGTEEALPPLRVILGSADDRLPRTAPDS